MVTEVKRSQLEVAIEASWATLAEEKGPQERGIETLLVEAGAGGDGKGGGVSGV